jgi:hypothetical protein
MDTIDYVATDSASLVSATTRTVIIQATNYNQASGTTQTVSPQHSHNISTQ